MRVANPIYDAVFKYLMEDMEIARGVVSRLTGLDIASLQLLPQESTHQVAGQVPTSATAKRTQEPEEANSQESEKTLWVYRLDFAAEVRTSMGVNRRIVIELQKAHFMLDVHRFRLYLAEQYSKKEDFARPILPVYILGFQLEEALPAVTVCEHKYYDGLTGSEIRIVPAKTGAMEQPQVLILPERKQQRKAWRELGKILFVEQLVHDGIFVQITPETLAKADADEISGDKNFNRDLARLLRFFDQNKVGEDRHFLEIDGKMQEMADDDPLLRRVMRKLQAAAADKTTLKRMDIEDEIVRLTESHKAETERERMEKEEERKLKEEALERERAAVEKQQNLEEQLRLFKEKARQMGLDL